MFDIKTKEHLAYFMQTGVLRLGKYDLRFVQNIHHIAMTGKSITTNQVALFDKLVEKYNRQLTKHGVTKNKIKTLTWGVNIIDSDPKHTQAFVTIEDTKIFFTAPFNKNFLAAFRKIENNSFKWMKEDKRYTADYSTLALKHVITTAASYYPIVNYCPITSELLNTLSVFNTIKYWSPTLVNVNGRYIIAAANESLLNAINHITLNIEPKCLHELATYGINVDENLLNGDPLLEFASKFMVEEDYLNTDRLIEWLSILECDSVIMLGKEGMLFNYRKSLQEKIRDAGIPIIFARNNTELEFKNAIVFHLFRGKSLVTDISKNIKVKKVVRLTNSTPIDIK